MKSFNEVWENKIYSKSRQINNYPYDLVVSLIARNFFTIPMNQRKKIKILDLGCGTGNHAKFIAENGFEVYGLDGSTTAINYCRKKFKSLNLKGNFVKGDFLNLPYPDVFFDCVLDRESLYANKFETIKKTISQVFQRLKVGGLFISFMYNTQHPCIRTGKYVEPNTYGSFTKESDFFSTGLAHFVDIKEVLNLYSLFKIKNIISHSAAEVYNQAERTIEFEEYIIIAKKEND